MTDLFVSVNGNGYTFHRPGTRGRVFVAHIHEGPRWRELETPLTEAQLRSIANVLLVDARERVRFLDPVSGEFRGEIPCDQCAHPDHDGLCTCRLAT